MAEASASSEELPPAKVAELKSTLDAYLQEHGMYAQIRELVDQFRSGQGRAGAGAGAGAGASTNSTSARAGAGGASSSNPDDLFDAVEEAGLIDDLIDAMMSGKDPASRVAARESATAAVDPLHRYLHLKVMGGRAFLEHLKPDDSEEDAECYMLHVHCGNQRARSSLVAAAVEPKFNESFLINLQPAGMKAMVDVRTLLRTNMPVNMVLCRVRRKASSASDSKGAESGSRVAAAALTNELDVQLVATCSLDWRRALGRGTKTMAVNLQAVGAEARMGVTVGILDVRMEILPKPAPGAAIPQTEISNQLTIESGRDKKACHDFFQYAQRWWSDYTQIDAQFKHRRVKIFAEDETGKPRIACSFVTPMRAGRLLDSPRHAARFVSLLPSRRRGVVGASERVETWQTMNTFVSLREGDVADHAILLCSLLLGFRLDAYVVVGTAIDAAGQETYYSWVMTRDIADNGRPRAVFWEAETGRRCGAAATTMHGLRFCRVGCVFNHQRFYANIQKSDAATSCLFDLENAGLWKSMDERLLMDALPASMPIPLCAPTLDATKVALQVEEQLRLAVEAERESLGLSTRWDEDMAFLFSAALSSYESEQITGSAYGTSEFSQSVKRAVPVGHTFKAYPICFSHMSPTLMMAAFRQAKVVMDIFKTRGDHVRFSVRAKAYPYPEETVAVWVMLGVTFRPTADQLTRHNAKQRRG